MFWSGTFNKRTSKMCVMVWTSLRKNYCIEDSESDGVLVNQILGVTKLPETTAMSRGKKLEAQVIQCIEKKFQVKLNFIGLQLNPKYPLFGASPDAICEEYVVEVKWPQSQKTFNKDNNITAKYKAQVQLQMFLLNRKKCLFCVSDPEFENNSNFSFAWVEYDEDYPQSIMNAAEYFWSHNIYPHLFNSVKTMNRWVMFYLSISSIAVTLGCKLALCF